MYSFFITWKRKSLCRLYLSTHISEKLNILKSLSSEAQASSVAIDDGRGYLTYRQLDTLTTLMAQHIQHQIPSNCTTISGFNCPNRNYVLSLLTTWKLGLRFLPLCPSHPKHELEYLLKDSHTQFILYSPVSRNDPLAAKETESLIESFNIKSLNVDTILRSFDEDKETLLHSSNVVTRLTDAQHGGLILYTSGTTGSPKGVYHNSANINAMIDNLVVSWEYKSTDKLLHFLPLHHLHGVLNKLLCVLAAGGTVELCSKNTALFLWKKLAQHGRALQLHKNTPAASQTPHSMERLNTVVAPFGFQTKSNQIHSNVNTGFTASAVVPYKPLTLFMAVPTIYARLIETARSMLQTYDINIAEAHHIVYESDDAFLTALTDLHADMNNEKEVENEHENEHMVEKESTLLSHADNLVASISNHTPTDSNHSTKPPQSSKVDTISLLDLKHAIHALRRMRCHVSGSAALPDTVLEDWKDLTGHTLLERYGMTETGMVLSNPIHGERLKGYVGLPLPNMHCRIVSDSETVLYENKNNSSSAISSRSSGRGTQQNSDNQVSGELRVKGPSVFQEYLNRETDTRAAFDIDGYFKTGDIVSADPIGRFKILGRNSVDIIKSGGYKLSALEIEREILAHNNVVETAVFGTTDAVFGETVVAVIVPRDLTLYTRDNSGHPSTPTGNELQTSTDHFIAHLKEFLNERLAHYKQPRIYRVVTDIPRNHLGKVNKKDLRKTLGY